MKNDVYYLFAILKGKNELVSVPINVFISENYEIAKLYFQGWLYGEQNPELYKLYKIGNINKKLKIEETKVFITGGYEINQRQKFDNTKEKITQIKFELEKRRNAEANKKLNMEENIKILFGDNNEQRKKII